MLAEEYVSVKPDIWKSMQLQPAWPWSTLQMPSQKQNQSDVRQLQDDLPPKKRTDKSVKFPPCPERPKYETK